jgi:hypothetical protein
MRLGCLTEPWGIPNPDSVAASRAVAAGMGSGGGGSPQTTATLQGSVTDPGDAAVPGVTVELKNTATGSIRTTITTADGAFRFNGVLPAEYSLSAKAVSGFKAVTVNGINLTDSELRDLGQIKLALGSVTEAVSVTAASTPVQTTSSENSKLVDQTQLGR